MALPSTMKVVHQPDPLSGALVLESSPLPTPSSTHPYLVRVHAASPCRGELTWEANYPQLFPEGRERVPCTECAGVVVSVHPSLRDPQFRPGDDVFFRADPQSTGCLREYTVARASWLARKPKSLDWVAAAATPLSALTAYQGLFRHAPLDAAALEASSSSFSAARERNSSLRVLITGAGGAVGSWAVQLAAAAGVGSIVAVSGPSRADDVRRLGATEVIDYTKTSIADWAAAGRQQECDIVLDCVGGETLAGCWAAVRDGGVLLSVAGLPDAVRPADQADKKLAESKWFLVEPRGDDLAVIARLVDEGRCAPPVDSVFPLGDFVKAFDRVAQRDSKGKVVITVAGQ